MSSLEIGLPVIILLVVLALLFDFMNGFHDAANSIATVVSTRVLKPHQAVLWAALFNVIAIFIFQLKVATTIGKGTIDPVIVDHYVIFGALVGAILWNVITWYYGIPSSSSHALIGGLVGAAVAKGGFHSLIWAGLGKTILFIFVAPFLGFMLGGLMMVAVAWLCIRVPAGKADAAFRRLQLISAAMYSLGHGGNDAQKTIGIIWMLLLAANVTDPAATRPDTWVIVACYMSMGLGTMFGGWRIVKTMGNRITKLDQPRGFCANFGGALTLFMATAFGIPVSTTHTITGAIAGVGTTAGAKQVRWGVARGIFWAWILTIPATALIAALAWGIGHLVL
ncbi:inorganic phosphate transporter [Denitratisoma oestradiolicum]|uniref:Putative low-affinity inorganic phosphate transporter n=1 Tax=Denitratisoma oestradiolicum TaxID=311182 RepID=A0A6S6XRA8_9PROT|nr:inorganic phosphate transporter [Denitratisoma oestradiolicum]TWO81306.1 anion permease [Denitratisoma oestradiolicum]CAB1368491.1 putative low-affinity inorganic phosphate transporter [Denitratisoma oestradiolicum]